MRPASQRRLCCALLLAVVLAATISHAATITLSGGSLKYIGMMASNPSRSTAVNTCKNAGGILPSDYSSNIQTSFATLWLEANPSTGLCQLQSSQYNRNCYGAYTAGTAAVGSCAENIRTSYDASNWDTGCNYRWTQGWFSRLSDDGYTGVTFWKSTWANLNTAASTYYNSYANMLAYSLTIDDSRSANVYASGALNDYTQGFRWNASYQCSGTTDNRPQCVSPRGKLYVAMGTRNVPTLAAAFIGMRVDVSATASTDNIPFSVNNYMVICQWQGVEGGFYATTQLPSQYPFVQGWKTLTWAQSHWWVIFLIVAVVILIVLFIILIYCCCTRKPLPEGERIDTMSMREREGTLYVVMDEEVDEEMDESKGTLVTTTSVTGPHFVSGGGDSNLAPEY